MFRKNIKLLSIVFFSTELEASGQIFRPKLPLGFSEIVGRISETVKVPQYAVCGDFEYLYSLDSP